jgi:hypothetical protein
MALLLLNLFEALPEKLLYNLAIATLRYMDYSEMRLDYMQNTLRFGIIPKLSQSKKQYLLVLKDLRLNRRSRTTPKNQATHWEKKHSPRTLKSMVSRSRREDQAYMLLSNLKTHS